MNPSAEAEQDDVIDARTAPSDVAHERDVDVPLVLRIARVDKSYQKRYQEYIPLRLEAFDHFASLSAKDKRRIRPRLEECLKPYARAQAWGAWGGSTFTSVTRDSQTSLVKLKENGTTVAQDSQTPLVKLKENGITLAILLACILSTLIAPILLGGFEPATLLVAGVGLLVAGILVVSLFDYIDSRRRYVEWAFGIFIIYAAGAWFVKDSAQRWLPGVLRDGLLSGLIGAVAFFFVYLVVILARLAAATTVRRTHRRRYPKEDVVDMLCWAVELSEAGRRGGRTIEWEPKVLWLLEAIATRIEYQLYRQLCRQDHYTDAWLRQRTREMAAGVRELKRWALLGEPKDVDRLVTELARRLLGVIDGTWSAFKPAESAESAEPGVRGQRWLRMVRGLTAAAFPLAIVAALRIFPNSLGEAATASITLSAILWFLVNISAWLDPDYAKKADVTGISDLKTAILGSRR
jgi:hypothetical protein